MQPLERRAFRRIRAELLQRASGDVLELGCGTGINFDLYRNVNVIAIEPNAIMRQTAVTRAEQARVPVQVMEGSAEELPFENNTFDTIVGTLVFCTIPDPRKALQEAIRVCKPGGKLLLFEHVLLRNKALATLQHALNPLWKRVCDGCHLNRDTLELLRQEGVAIRSRQSYYRQVFVTVEGIIG